MIYLDNAATTQMDEVCLKAFADYGCNSFYNPSALYKKALEAANAIKNARNILAKSLGAKAEEIIFTASGSEGDNISLLCSMRVKSGKVIVGSSEHSAVYNAALELKVRGYDVIFAPCDRYGRTDIEKLGELLDERVALVSIMHVCNETGAVNDLAEISKLIKAKSPRAIFHSDGVQAYGKIPVRVKELGVDLYTVSAHKIHAPKGVGALYCRSGLFLKTFVYGGGQEFGIRAATENVGGIAAFASVVEKDFPKMKENYEYVVKLRNYLIEKISDNFENLKINTDLANSSPYILSFAMNSARGEVLVHCLEDRGVLVGTGSACSSRKSTKRIPMALGIDEEFAQGMLRISFCEKNTVEDIDVFIDALKVSLEELIKYQNKSAGKDDCILSRLKKRT